MYIEVLGLKINRDIQVKKNKHTWCLKKKLQSLECSYYGAALFSCIYNTCVLQLL